MQSDPTQTFPFLGDPPPSLITFPTSSFSSHSIFFPPQQLHSFSFSPYSFPLFPPFPPTIYFFLPFFCYLFLRNFFSPTPPIKLLPSPYFHTLHFFSSILLFSSHPSSLFFSFFLPICVFTVILRPLFFAIQFILSSPPHGART